MQIKRYKVVFMMDMDMALGMFVDTQKQSSKVVNRGWVRAWRFMTVWHDTH